MFHYIVECGLSPEQFWDYTWYELSLVSRRHHYQTETQWNHTRHIMAALTGEKVTTLMPLSFDKARRPVAPSIEERERIKNQWQHLLKPAHEH